MNPCMILTVAIIIKSNKDAIYKVTFYKIYQLFQLAIALVTLVKEPNKLASSPANSLYQYSRVIILTFHPHSTFVYSQNTYILTFHVHYLELQLRLIVDFSTIYLKMLNCFKLLQLYTFLYSRLCLVHIFSLYWLLFPRFSCIASSKVLMGAGIYLGGAKPIFATLKTAYECNTYVPHHTLLYHQY